MGLRQWVKSIDPNCFGLPVGNLRAFNDDRFARALDKLYFTARASLMTEIDKTVSALTPKSPPADLEGTTIANPISGVSP